MSNCVFCSGQAISKNEQKFPVCIVHKKQEFPDMKCACGEFLFVKESKYGAFFLCSNCGPVSVKKAVSMNDVQPTKKSENTVTEITVRSDEVDFL